MFCTRLTKRYGDMLLSLSKNKQYFQRCISGSCCHGLRSEVKVLQRYSKQNHLFFQQRFASGGGKDSSKGPWIFLFGFGVVAVGATMVLRNIKKKKFLEEAKKRSVTAGELDIGGPFTLTDHNGKAVTEKDFHGQWVLIYFGFTHCPDICPEELEKLAEVMNFLDVSKKKVTTLFITLDAERDTPQKMKEYVSEMSPDILGLTGTPEQVREAAIAFKIYHVSGPVDEDGDYVIDHSIVTYLVNPVGKVVEYYFRSRSAKEIANSIIMTMAQYKKKD